MNIRFVILGTLVVVGALVAFQFGSGELGRYDVAGDSARGVLTDIIVNLIIFASAASWATSKEYNREQSTYAVILCNVFSEIVSFFMDNTLCAGRLNYYFGEKDGDVSKECPTRKASQGPLYNSSRGSILGYIVDIIVRMGDDVGLRSFIIMMVNFMISIQFEGAISHLMREYKLPNIWPIVVWWIVTVLCGTAVNIVRFNWSYAIYDRGGSISSDVVLLYTLTLCIMFFVNSYTPLSAQFRIGFAVSMMLLVILSQNAGALNVPIDCATAKTPKFTARTVLQLIMIFMVMTLLIYVANKGIHDKKSVKSEPSTVKGQRIDESEAVTAQPSNLSPPIRTPPLTRQSQQPSTTSPII